MTELNKFIRKTKVVLNRKEMSFKNRHGIKTACASAMLEYRDMFNSAPVLNAFYVEYKLTDGTKINMNLIDLKYVYEELTIYATFKEI